MDDRSRQTIWLVNVPGGGSVPSLYPHVRTSHFCQRPITSSHENWNSSFTDFTAPAALGRLIEGEVRSVDGLQAAEIALQALMWHERVDILVPGFRASHQNFAGYTRESDPRTQVAFDLFSAAAAYDHIFAVEDVEVAAGVVRE